MTKHIDMLADLRAQNRNLMRLLFALMLLSSAGFYLLWDKAANLNIHLSANPAPGEVIEVREGQSAVPSSNLYGFAFYVWQQINHWPKDGSKDYGQQIFAMQHYLTPQCQQWLEKNMNDKKRGGELAERTRSIAELMGRGFMPSRVVSKGDNKSWTVLLDMELTETMKGQVIKSVPIRFPVEVVRYEIDLRKNAWKLAIDCSASSTPQRLEAADLSVSPPATDFGAVAAKLPAVPVPPDPAASAASAASELRVNESRGKQP
jgi:integrating conjugative element protein (TIGR03746 family)